MQYEYNESMAHQCAYMMKVAKLCALESYADADNNANCHATMKEEMHTLANRESWDLVHAPKGVKPIGYRWVYKVKYNTNGSVNRYKAR